MNSPSNPLRIFVSVGLLGLVMSGSSVAGQKPKTEPRLQLHAELLPSAVHTTEPPALLVSVVNLGLGDAWLSRRFAFNYAEAPLPFRDLWLEIKDRGTGKLSPFSGEVHVGFTSPESLLVLGPAESVGTWLSLGPIFGMVHGRSYELTVHWRNGIPDGKRPPRGVIQFTGELVAAPVVVEY